MNTRLFKGLFLSLTFSVFIIFGALSFNLISDSSHFFFGIGFILLFLMSNLVFYYFNLVRQSWEEVHRFNRQLTQGDYSTAPYLPTLEELGDDLGSFEKLETALSHQFKILSQERNQLGAILRNMREGVLVTDVQTKVSFANPALYGILPLKNRCEGKILLESLRNQDIQEAIETALNTLSPIEKEVRLATETGEKILTVYVMPLLDSEEPQGSLSVFLDVTPLRQLENARKNFVANVSHELKTPLTNIRGYAETLLSGALQNPAVADRFVQKIEKNSTQLYNLIEDLLRLAEIDAGRLERRPMEVSLMEIVTEIESEFLETLKKKRIIFNASVPIDLLVYAEPSALKQILINLVDNAVKYTPEGGGITISAGREGDRCRVAIRDTGVGIPEADLPHVFERFYRVDKARSREIGGTGLGLAIVKHLVQMQGGKVGVHSQIGQGSEFFFTLPLPPDLSSISSPSPIATTI